MLIILIELQEKKYLSVKLYKEGNRVGGGHTDLVNDLVDPKYPGSIGAMRLLLLHKTLEGEDLDQTGKLIFISLIFRL